MMTKIKKYSLIPYMLILFQMVCVAQSVDTNPRQKLSPTEERKFDYFFYEGLKLKNSEKYDASFEMFRHCLEIDSTSSAALFELSSYYIELEQLEKAMPLLKKAVLYSPDNHEYRSTMATLSFSMGMYSEAVEAYEILTRIFPEKPELNYYLAESYARMGETGKAIDTFDALENVMGMNEALSMEKFQLYMSMDEKDKAFGELKKLSEKFPTEARYPIILGDLYLQQEDKTEALKYYQKAHEIDPESPYYSVSMANYYEKTGQKDSAELQINIALVNNRLDINTKLVILTRYIVQLQRSEQNIESAYGLFQTLLEQHPDDSQLKLFYGDFLLLQNKDEEARFQFQLVTEIEPENIQAWIQLLRLSNQASDWDEVIRICKRCQEIFPDIMDFYMYQGIACYQKKDFQAAIDIYTAAIAKFSASDIMVVSEFYGQIGDTYFRMREIDKAFNAYEEALKINDKNIMVLNNYAYYLSLLKKELAKAERMSALTIKMEPGNATYLDTYAWVFFVQGNYMLAKMYIEQAISRDRSGSSELADHYGDILYLSGEKEKAVEQWEKAKELGKKSATLEKKIAEKTYFEATEEERLNADDDFEAITIEKDTGGKE